VPATASKVTRLAVLTARLDVASALIWSLLPTSVSAPTAVPL
jgi:hypothetical protein